MRERISCLRQVCARVCGAPPASTHESIHRVSSQKIACDFRYIMRDATPDPEGAAQPPGGARSEEGRLDVDQREEHAELLDLHQLEAAAEAVVVI